jgi:hypothetical protein
MDNSLKYLSKHYVKTPSGKVIRIRKFHIDLDEVIDFFGDKNLTLSLDGKPSYTKGTFSVTNLNGRLLSPTETNTLAPRVPVSAIMPHAGFGRLLGDIIAHT